MAAFNALLEVDESACTEFNAEDVLMAWRTDTGGHRRPFSVRGASAPEAGTCWVLELNPRPGDLPAGQAAEVLPQADVVALTGTSLLNHTFDELISLCRPGAFVILLGASAPLSPVLLERGVDAVAGTRVVDVPAVLRAVGEAAMFRQIPASGC